MERYINSYATENDIQIALENGELLKPYVAYIEDVNRIDWNSKEIVDYTTEYLTFNILSAGTINWTASRTSITKTIDYKKNNGEWVSITSNTSSSAPTINVVEGDKLQFKGNNTAYSSSGSGIFNKLYNSFGGSALFEIEGNIMSLIYGDDFKNNSTISSDYTFGSLFYNCTGLTSAENLVLPATTLADYCYEKMFYGCTKLTTAPALPANTLADYCYDSMFKGCTSLTTASELPATTLANRCYYYMFDSCTSLATAPELPATTLAQDCYKGMFRQCTSLTTASELPAMTLVEGCYSFMFANCEKLNYIKCLATDISTNNYTQGWVQNVASTGTFVKKPNATWTTGDNGIPTGWTVQDA